MKKSKLVSLILAIAVAIFVLSGVCIASSEPSAELNSISGKVIVFTIDDQIELEIETAAFEKTISEAAGQDPCLILLEIDTPGGRISFARRICTAITGVKNCPVIAFIKGGKYGGALSAGAAIAFACDKTYMANGTTIGAATVISVTKGGKLQGLKKAYGEDVGEKFSSAWRAYLASLAEHNQRPALLARAMVDRDIEVVEVEDGSKNSFIEPVNRNSNQKIIHTWSKKGSLLTLTAAEAAKCKIADETVDSREELLAKLGAKDVEVVINQAMQEARAEIEKAEKQLGKIRKALDFDVKKSQNRLPVKEIMKLLRSAKSKYKMLMRLAKKYPDLNLKMELLEDGLNSINVDYERIKRESSNRRRGR